MNREQWTQREQNAANEEVEWRGNWREHKSRKTKRMKSTQNECIRASAYKTIRQNSKVFFFGRRIHRMAGFYFARACEHFFCEHMHKNPLDKPPLLINIILFAMSAITLLPSMARHGIRKKGRHTDEPNTFHYINDLKLMNAIVLALPTTVHIPCRGKRTPIAELSKKNK